MFSLATVTGSVYAVMSGVGTVLAQTSQPAGDAPGWVQFIRSSPMFLPIALLVLVYVFIFSSRRKTEREKKDQLNNIKRGDRVQTIGGILGNVVQVEDARILLKVDESSNTKIWFSRTAVHRVLTEEKSDKAETK